MLIQADYQQMVREVKDRNDLYKTLLEIKKIAAEAAKYQDLDSYKDKLRLISEKCENILNKAK